MARRRADEQPLERRPGEPPRYRFMGYPSGTWWWEIPDLRARAVERIRLEGASPSDAFFGDVAPPEVQDELAAEALLATLDEPEGID